MLGKVILFGFLVMFCAYSVPPVVYNAHGDYAAFIELTETVQDIYFKIINGTKNMLVDDEADSKEMKDLKEHLRKAYDAIVNFDYKADDHRSESEKQEAIVKAAANITAALTELYQEILPALVWVKAREFRCDIFSDKNCESKMDISSSVFLAGAEVIVGVGRLLLPGMRNLPYKPLVFEEL